MRAMSRYFKIGLGLLVPVILVFQVLSWAYSLASNLVMVFLPDNYAMEWWLPPAGAAAVVLFVLLVGLIFSFVKPLRWGKDKVEELILAKIPGINKVYAFGREISDSFIADIKEDGDMQVVEVFFGGQRVLGILTDPSNSIVFIPTAPNPLNGFVVKVEDYRKVDVAFVDFIRMLAGLGKVKISNW